MKNKRTKLREESAKTTVARKVEKAPWKTWGAVLEEKQIEGSFGGKETKHQLLKYLVRDETTLADLSVPS